MVLELPSNALSIFILGTIVYWMANLYDSAQHYIILQGILILAGIVAVSVGKCEHEKKDTCLIYCFRYQELSLELQCQHLKQLQH